MENKCKEYKGLLMGLMDGELSPEESQDVNSHLIKCAACRHEYDELQKTSEKLNGMTFTEPLDKDIIGIWKAPYSRAGRNAGFILILGGWLLMMLFSIYQIFLIENNKDMIPKIAFAGIIIGASILLISVIRERIKTYKKDPYKEVQR